MLVPLHPPCWFSCHPRVLQATDPATTPNLACQRLFVLPSCSAVVPAASGQGPSPLILHPGTPPPWTTQSSRRFGGWVWCRWLAIPTVYIPPYKTLSYLGTQFHPSPLCGALFLLRDWDPILLLRSSSSSSVVPQVFLFLF